MARRESQGLQITLIVFVMLTIILAVTTIAFWNKSKTLTEQNTKLSSENSTANSAASTALEEARQLKSWIGMSEATVESIGEQYKRDMSTYARSAPEVNRTYKDVPQLLFAALQQRNKQVSDLRQQLKQAQADFDQSTQQMQTALDAATTAKSTAEAELLQTRNQFATDRGELNSQKDQLSSDVQTLRQQLDELTAKSEEQLQDLTREMRNKDLIIGQRDDQLENLTTSRLKCPTGKFLRFDLGRGVS